jgi:DNA repair exonuclease SbcCD ATPase subunit
MNNEQEYAQTRLELSKKIQEMNEAQRGLHNVNKRLDEAYGELERLEGEYSEAKQKLRNIQVIELLIVSAVVATIYFLFF